MTKSNTYLLWTPSTKRHQKTDQSGSNSYGPGAGGSLIYWIIHSYEVIPSPSDFAPQDSHKAFDLWWHVFNGLHTVLGYQMEMWIVDGVMPNFGLYLGLGALVVSTWLQSVHDNMAHYKTNGMDQLYHDNYRGIDKLMGRATEQVLW